VLWFWLLQPLSALAAAVVPRTIGAAIIAAAARRIY
jgi:hypothetical protein